MEGKDDKGIVVQFSTYRPIRFPLFMYCTVHTPHSHSGIGRCKVGEERGKGDLEVIGGLDWSWVGWSTSSPPHLSPGEKKRG